MMIKQRWRKWKTAGRVVQPSGQRIDGVEQSKRGGVFVCDMGVAGVRDNGRGAMAAAAGGGVMA